MALYTCVASGIFLSGRSWSFRQHFSSSAVLATVQTDWAAAMASAWTDGTHGLQTLYPTTTVFNLTKTYSMVITAGTPGKIIATAAAETAATHAGTSTNDGLPDQDVVLVTLRAAGTGPNNRGRTNLPACDETLPIGDVLPVTPATRVTTAMTALRTAMAAAGHIHVLWNDKSSARDPTIGTTKPVVFCGTDRVIRTQRRRVRKEAALYV